MSIAEILSLISTISYVIAAVSLILAVFFWFFFKIPSVIGDLSGRTAKKSIARMRISNERAGGQGYKPSATNASRGKLTDTMQHSRKLAGDPKKKNTAEPKKKATAQDQMPETGLLSANKAEANDRQQTDLLDSTETTALLVGKDTIVPLHEGSKTVNRAGGKKLNVLDEVMIIHTNEVI